MARTGLNGSLASYRALLACVLGLYRPLETALEGLDWSATGLDLAARRKSPWLMEDLAHFGVAAPRGAATPAPLTAIAEGLGVLYVLEGATLGGQVIGRSLKADFGIGPENGGRFFASYGAETGRMWRSFVAVLESVAGDPRQARAIERTAIATFRRFDEALAGMSAA